MEIIDLGKDQEAKFLEHVHGNPLEYYFYILDWEFNREDSKFLLALEGEDVSRGTDGARASFKAELEDGSVRVRVRER